MTILISIFGAAGRFAGDLLTTALGWAGSLLFGRVPRAHQKYVIGMMALSFLWLILAIALLVPPAANVLVATTPHPSSTDAWIGISLLVGVIALPLLVGLIGHLVPAHGRREDPAEAVIDVLRGYPLTPLIAGFLIFLALVGLVRKARSRMHDWSDVHVAVVIEPDGYDRLVDDLDDVLDRAALPVRIVDAPAVLTAPARILSAVSARGVAKMRPDRIVELRGRDLRIGVYPSDIALSGPIHDVTRARAAILSRLPASSAHLTTSAEAQRVEDALAKVTLARPAARGRLGESAREALGAIDARLLELKVPTAEWDILYRLRLQVERDVLAGADPSGGQIGPTSARHRR